MRAQTNQSAGVDVCSQKGLGALCHQLKKTALQNLIQEALVRQYAADHHITVSKSDFNRQWVVIFQNKFHSNEPVLRAYAKSIGITEKDIEDMVRQDLLQQAVMYQVTRNMPSSAPAVRFARLSVGTAAELKSVRQALKSGQSFLSVAAHVALNPSSPCAQERCGEYGWIPDPLVPREERQIITSPDGAIVGPFVGQASYTLILVEGHQSHLPLIPSQDLAMREQLFTRWVTAQKQRASIHLFVAT